MKILIASLFFPQFSATHAGGRFVAELVKELSARHEVHLAGRIEETELPAAAEMKAYCREMFLFPYGKAGKRGVLTALRLLTSYLCFSYRLNGIVRSGGYDLVQVEWVEAGVLIGKSGTTMVLDAHDVITKPAERSSRDRRGAARVVHRLLYRLIRMTELRTMRKFDIVMTRGEYDKEYLLAMDGKLPVRVVPHPAGLDVSEQVYEKENNSILFLASFRHRQTNVDAAWYFYRRVFPLVRARIPGAKFIIAGYGPPVDLTALPGRDPFVSVPGFVENIDACYKRAAVFVAPILVGGGIIVKVLDAMAAGVPVVTTSYGNEGIQAESGRHLLIADNDEAFAAAVIRLLTDEAYANRIGKQGQEYIRTNFGREAVFQKIETMYRDLTVQSAARTERAGANRKR